VQATVVLLLDESPDLLLAPTLLALAPLAIVVIPALSPYWWNWSKTLADDVSEPVARFHPGGLRHVLGTFVRSRSRTRLRRPTPQKSTYQALVNHFYRRDRGLR